MGAIAGLVDRWGRTGFALVSSLAWGLPLAVWAGTFDLGPPRRWPWYFFGAGLLLLAGWIALMTQLRRVPTTARPHRLDLAAMTASERRWYALLAICVIGLVGWLNGAATVDGGALLAAAAAGSRPAQALLAALLLLAVVLVAGAVVAWRRAAAAGAARTGASSEPRSRHPYH